MELFIGLVAIVAPFVTAISIVWFVHNGPKARAQAEIMKAEALQRLGTTQAQLGAPRDEKLALTVMDQEKRIDSLEEEVAFLRKLLDKR